MGAVFRSKPTEMARVDAQVRKEIAETGPSLQYPTWAVLSTYTIDPAALYAELSSPVAPPAGDLVRLVGAVFQGIDALAPPRLEAALLRVLAGRDGISADQIRAPDGTRVWAIGAEDAHRRWELLVDGATGRVVGSRDIVRVTSADPPSSTACPKCPPSPVVPRTNTNTYLWTTSLVDP